MLHIEQWFLQTNQECTMRKSSGHFFWSFLFRLQSLRSKRKCARTRCFQTNLFRIDTDTHGFIFHIFWNVEHLTCSFYFDRTMANDPFWFNYKTWGTKIIRTKFFRVSWGGQCLLLSQTWGTNSLDDKRGTKEGSKRGRLEEKNTHPYR